MLRTCPVLMFYPASLVALLRHRRPLLLQGPMGPFFARFAAFLEAQDQQVRKINFNGGDALFYVGEGAQAYTGSMQEWPAWLERHLRLWRIDALVMFGQSRPVHQLARRVSRPSSESTSMCSRKATCAPLRDAGAWRRERLFPAAAPSDLLHRPPARGRATASGDASALSCAGALRLPVPARDAAGLAALPPACLSPLDASGRAGGMSGLRGGVRKLLHAVRDRGMLEHLTSPTLSQRWFLFPLQVHNDAQLLHHRPARSATQGRADARQVVPAVPQCVVLNDELRGHRRTEVNEKGAAWSSSSSVNARTASAAWRLFRRKSSSAAALVPPPVPGHAWH